MVDFCRARSGLPTPVGGAALQLDGYHSETFPQFDYDYFSPALFAQVDTDLGKQIAVAASARWDEHSEYGSQFSPRVSLLYGPGPWRLRAS